MPQDCYFHVIFKSRHLIYNAINPVFGLLMHGEHAALVEFLFLQRLVHRKSLSTF